MKQIARTLAYVVCLTGLLAAPIRAEEVKAGDLVITQGLEPRHPERRENRRRLSDHREQGRHG